VGQKRQGEQKKLGQLLREAAQLLESEELRGANEVLERVSTSDLAVGEETDGPPETVGRGPGCARAPGERPDGAPVRREQAESTPGKQ
jgi:hypothetical protein